MPVDKDNELAGAYIVDGQLCIDLCMAEPEVDKPRVSKPIKPVYDKNGFRWLVNGLTSDSGAGDTVGPADAYPEYSLEESPGSQRGLHYIAAGGADIKNVDKRESPRDYS